MEALFSLAHDPLASAVVAEAHRTGSELVSVDDDSLGELRPAFDDIKPLTDTADGSIDDALARAVADLREAGRTVAVLSSPGAQAIWSADVALGMMPEPGAGPPPWYADLLLPDLAAAWRVLHALPGRQGRRPARCRDIGWRHSDGIAVDDPWCPRHRARTGDHRCGGRAAVGIPAGTRHHQRGRPAPGSRRGMACDVGRARPEGFAPARLPDGPRPRNGPPAAARRCARTAPERSPGSSSLPSAPS